MNKSFLILLVLVIFLGAGFGGSFVGGVIYGQSLEDDAESQLSPRLGAGQFQGGGAEAGPRQGGQGRRGQARQGGQGSQDADPSQEQAGVASATGDSLDAGPAGNSPGAEMRAQARAVGQGRQGGRDDASRVSQESAQETESGAAMETPQIAADSAPAGGDAALADAGGAASRGSESRPPGGRGGAAGVVQQLEGDRLTVTSPQGEVMVAFSDTTTIYLVGETDRESLAAGANVRVTGARDDEGVVNAQAVIIVPEGADNLFGVGRQSGRQGRGRP